MTGKNEGVAIHELKAMITQMVRIEYTYWELHLII